MAPHSCPEAHSYAGERERSFQAPGHTQVSLLGHGAKSSALPEAEAQLSVSACSTSAFKDEEECRVTPGAPRLVSQHSNPQAHKSRLAASTASAEVSAKRKARAAGQSARPRQGERKGHRTCQCPEDLTHVNEHTESPLYETLQC